MNSINQIILVPVDFDALSLKALKQAYSMSRKLNLGIELLYVIDEPSGFFSLFSSISTEDIEKNIMEKLEGLRKKASNQTTFPISISIEKGKVYNVIVDVAEKRNARFIIMGTRSGVDEGVEQGLIGGNTSKVIRFAKCPVITVNDKIYCHNFRSILLPLDLTKETRQKVTLAVELSRTFNCKVRVVSSLYSDPDMIVMKRLQAQMNQVSQFFKKHKVEYSSEFIKGSESDKSPVPAILKYIENNNDIDLVMIMTQQEIVLVDYFMGSTAQDLIRKSPVPVLSVVPKDLGEQSSFMSF